jgi:TPP-dependent trihydroxycyclohexane-1,2-dione (THcHDO) dehydratase
VPAEVFGERAPDHHLHQIRFRERRRRARGDVTSVAQHRDRVAQPEDLRHAVRHVDAGHTARLQTARSARRVARPRP